MRAASTARSCASAATRAWRWALMRYAAWRYGFSIKLIFLPCVVAPVFVSVGRMTVVFVAERLVFVRRCSCTDGCDRRVSGTGTIGDLSLLSVLLLLLLLLLLWKLIIRSGGVYKLAWLAIVDYDEIASLSFIPFTWLLVDIRDCVGVFWPSSVYFILPLASFLLPTCYFLAFYRYSFSFSS